MLQIVISDNKSISHLEPREKVIDERFRFI